MPHKPFRYSLPQLERRHPWLAGWLDACALVDQSVALALRLSKEQGRVAACKAGCAACCYQPIPLSPAELAGLALFLREKEGARAQEILWQNLESPAQNQRPCPFLYEGACQVYPVRPLACRRYLVSGQPCRMDEDATATRPADLIVPERKALEQALRLTLPYYEKYGPKLPPNAQFTDFAAVTTLIRQANWRKLMPPAAKGHDALWKPQ